MSGSREGRLEIELTLWEAEFADLIGELRTEFATRSGLNREPWGGDDAKGNPLGARGELAFAIYRGVKWEPEFRQPDTECGDVGGIDVKTTDLPHGCLPVQRGAAPDRPFVLAIVVGRRVRLAGWAFGEEAMQERFWREDIPHPCYMVRQPSLRKMPDRSVA